MRRAADMFILAVMVGVISPLQVIARDTNKNRLPGVDASFVVIHASENWHSLEPSSRLSSIQARMISEVESVLAEHRLDYLSRSALESHSGLNFQESGLAGSNNSNTISSIIPLSVDIVISGECSLRNIDRGYLARVELIASDALIGNRLTRAVGSHKDCNRDVALKIATRKTTRSLVDQLMSNSISDQYTEHYRLLITLPDEMLDEEHDRVEVIIENICQNIAEHVRPEVLTDGSLQYILFRVGHVLCRGATYSIWSTLKQELGKKLPEYSYRRKLSIGRFLWIDMSQSGNK